jgi:enterochelin esterase family protein
VSRAIQRLIERRPIDDARTRAFIDEHEFPIVEDGVVTFFFRGAADEIRLRHWIFGLPSSQPFQRVDGTDLWYLVMELPPCSRVEYKLERIVGEDRQWIMDPLNPRVAHDPYGANSVCYGQGYVRPEWTRSDDEARPGTLDELSIDSEALETTRRVLIVHDGDDYLRFAELKVVLDNLIHRLEIPPLIVALTQSADRLREYAADSGHARFLTTELVPALQSRFPLRQRSASRALMGASFGAVAALCTAWSHPGVYGGLLLQSGSFAFSDIGEHGRGPVFDPVAEFVNAFRENPGHPADRVFVSCGIYESLIYENRSLVPLLQSTKMEVRYVEARDGHNWDNWRDRLREGLSWLFPGPLWMVYE